MIADTSLNAYIELYPNLGRMQERVYSFLKKEGPLTNKQISKKLDMPINSVTPRVKELRSKGLVFNRGVIEQENKKKAIRWGVFNE